jgi:hypothetical protein
VFGTQSKERTEKGLHLEKAPIESWRRKVVHMNQLFEKTTVGQCKSTGKPVYKFGKSGNGGQQRQFLQAKKKKKASVKSVA